jgi:glutamine cyclotransferase
MNANLGALVFCLLLAALIPVAGCAQSPASPARDSAAAGVSDVLWQLTGNRAPHASHAAASDVPVYGYEVVNAWPHDTDAFTQGLVFHEGVLLESSGLYGRSTLREVELRTGVVLRQVEVPAEYFAEGLAVLRGRLFQLTWESQKGFCYDLAGLRLEREFAYQGDSWGLTTDGRWMILSDGSDQLRFLDPDSFEVARRLRVRFQGWPLDRLNELEYIRGEIYANVWGTDFVVRIDPADGEVVGVIDFTGLLEAADRGINTDVLNGIAYDAAGDRLFVTGKRWPRLFEVRLKPK